MSNLLDDAPGKKVLLMGNEALVRGAYEAGLNLACSYPGTPSSEVATLLFNLQENAPFRMEYGANEKVAMEIVAGAALGGLNCLTSMKHVGFNVAADPIGTLTYIGVRGALVIYNADDPSLFSSQNEQDNRAYARLFGIPVFEPSSAQEMKDMTVDAMQLSHDLGMPVMVRSTTRVAHLRGIVELGEVKEPAKPKFFEKEPLGFVTLPANATRMHKELLDRLKKAAAYSNKSKFNKINGNASSKLGVVSNGICVNYVEDAIHSLELTKNCAHFVMGFSYPEPDQAMLEFLKSKETILVVEELEPFIENWLRILAQKNNISVTILGKGCAKFSHLYEYNSEMVSEAMATAFKVPYNAPKMLDLQDSPIMPVRPPNLCPGCPHRMSYYAAKMACKDRNVIFPNDIGCYSLGFGAPLQMVDTILCMGSSASLPCGLEEAIKGTGQKILSFIGDSTFFHSGITGLTSAVYNGHKFTLVILDNQVTAMTGHQPSPCLDAEKDLRAQMAGLTAISPEAVCEALGISHIQVVKPTNLKKMQEAVEKALDYDGLSVIIAREPCPLHHKRQGKDSKLTFTIDQSVCNNCKVCISQYGCPAFQVDGKVISIDPTLCTGCAVCAQVCPSHAIKPYHV